MDMLGSLVQGLQPLISGVIGGTIEGVISGVGSGLGKGIKGFVDGISGDEEETDEAEECGEDEEGKGSGHCDKEAHNHGGRNGANDVVNINFGGAGGQGEARGAGLAAQFGSAWGNPMGG